MHPGTASHDPNMLRFTFPAPFIQRLPLMRSRVTASLHGAGHIRTRTVFLRRTTCQARSISLGTLLCRYARRISEQRGDENVPRKPLVVPASARKALAAVAAGFTIIASETWKRCKPGIPPSIPLPVSLAQAGSFQQVMSMLPVLRRTMSPEQCAYAATDLLQSGVSTPFTTRRVAGLFTVEMAAPHPDAPVLVIMHGYGSGSGLWLFNLDALAQHFRVFAVDWKGCGASDRPKWVKPSVLSGHAGSEDVSPVEQGERYFTESLEEWRRAMGLADPFVLMGHSLGGYLSAAYALHHPGRVSQLVLVSPCGIPVPPDPKQLAARRSHWLMGLLQWAWESDVTPQAIVRALGPFGEKWASNIVSARFRGMLAERRQDEGREVGGGKEFDDGAFLRYLYAITVADGSGEFALSTLLSFGAHAKEPMGPRLLHAARVGEVAEVGEPGHVDAGQAGQAHKLRIPITLLYGGSHDWMSAPAGLKLALDLRLAGVDAKTFLIDRAGHHLYMENPPQFHRVVLGRVLPLEQRRRRVGVAGRVALEAPGPEGAWPSAGAA